MRIFTIIVIVLLYCICECTNYYFSSSSGSDLNSGTQIEFPWKSFSKLQNVSIKAGDNILLKSNDIFNEQLLIQNISGTASNPVTITTYNTSNSIYYHRAIINKHNDSNNNTNSTILCLNCEGVIISYLELCYSHFGIAIVYDNPSVNVSNILIKQNYFHNINGYGFPNTSQWWGAAIIAGQNSNKQIPITIYNLNILNNLCNESDTFFELGNHYGIYNIHISSGVIKGNTMTYNYYNIIPLNGNYMSNYSIINNIFLRNAPIRQFDKGTTDLIITNGADNTSNVINNEFGYRGEWNTSKDGCAIDFERNANGTNVINNYFHHSYAAGIMIYGHPPQLSTNINISNNIFVEDGCYQQSGDHGAIVFMWPNTTGIVQNSIFIKCQNNESIPIFYDRGHPQNMETWVFINNTIYNTTKKLVDDPIVSCKKNNKNKYNSIDITAKCGKNVENDCIIKYTLDGSKPTINSKQYIESLSINVTTGVFFKSFKTDMIESAAVGEIIAPK